MTKLTLYKATINWHGEIHKLYTRAKSEGEAKINFCSQMADKLGIKPSAAHRRLIMPNTMLIKEE